MQIDRILVPTDFSATSLQALAAGVSFAQCFGATIDLVYVLEDLPLFPTVSFEHLPTLTSDDFYEKAVQESSESLKQLLEDKLSPEQRGQYWVHRGSPALEIIDCAQRHGHGLIVMSTHGHTGLKHVVLGSVTEKVVQQAPCPVLSVRAREDG